MTPTSTDDNAGDGQRGGLAWWTATPLYIRIIGGLILGVLVGVTLKSRPTFAGIETVNILYALGAITGLILKMLGALAPPLILVAVLDTLIKARLQGGVARRMIWLLVTNTLAAIFIGLLVANIVRPGQHAHIDIKHDGPTTAAAETHANPWAALLGNVPDSLLEPLVSNKVIGIILIGAAFGIAVRRLGEEDRRVVEQFVGVAFRA